MRLFAAALLLTPSCSKLIKVNVVGGCTPEGFGLVGDCSSNQTYCSCNLLGALVAASAVTGEDVTIELPSGDHTLCNIGGYKTGIGGVTVNDTSTALTLSAPAGAQLVEFVDGHGVAAYGSGTLLEAKHHNLTLTGITLKGGVEDYGHTGGLSVDVGASVVLNQCGFDANICHDCMQGEGGGSIQNWGTVHMRGGYISNSMGGCADGGCAAGGAIYNGGTMSVDGVEFVSNTAPVVGDGGAIANFGNLTVSNAIFSQNKAGGKGAAIFSCAAANCGGQDSNTCSQVQNTFDNNTGCTGGVDPTGNKSWIVCKSASDGADVIGC